MHDFSRFVQISLFWKSVSNHESRRHIFLLNCFMNFNRIFFKQIHFISDIRLKQGFFQQRPLFQINVTINFTLYKNVYDKNNRSFEIQLKSFQNFVNKRQL